MTRGKLAEWLEIKYAEWQPTQERKARSLRAFSDWLGLSNPLVIMLINGKRKTISRETADAIAARLGPEIYDLVGLDRPDPDLVRIEAAWPRISEERRTYIVRLAEKAAKDESDKTSARAMATARKD